MSELSAQTNTVLGNYAGTGDLDNVAIGYRAGENNTARRNIFIGSNSGRYFNFGYDNIAIGFQSGFESDQGLSNVFIGSQTGYFNKGSHNTFVGFIAGHTNQSGEYNAFFGNYAGYHNGSGYYNTFVGSESGFYNIAGHENTFVGKSSGEIIRYGYYNTYIGSRSGADATEGYKNVFIGYKAGYGENVFQKLIINNDSDNKPIIYGDFIKNSVGIGTKYQGSAYKLFVPGKMRATGYDVASDKRLKEDIQPLENVLSKVNKVEGITYLLKEDTKDNQSITSDSEGTNNKAVTETKKPTYYGFVAQDIQEIFPDLVTEDEGILAVNYMGMIPVLVEAIKEISSQRESLQQQRDSLMQELSLIKEVLMQKGILPASTSSTENTSLLQQNKPNPFNQNTVIDYSLPSEVRTASLVITNMNGVEVSRYSNIKLGQGQIEINAGSLPAGTYIYTLMGDGKKISAQRMVLTR